MRSALRWLLAVTLALWGMNTYAAVGVSTGSQGLALTDNGRVFLNNGQFGGKEKPALAVQELQGKHSWVVKPSAEVERFRAVVQWAPDAFLCRLAPDKDGQCAPNAGPAGVVQLSDGDVHSRLANALYAPSLDAGVSFEGKSAKLERSGDKWLVQVTALKSITVEHDVYKNRGIKYFTPLDRSVFKRAPAGWCSWYYFYQGVSEDGIVANTRWLRDNLLPFGCNIVQIDDGWQGVGHGNGENRDWFVIDKRFPHGMKWLADQIRAEGFIPGIWLCPFGQSDEKLWKAHPELFLKKPDGTSFGENLSNPDATGANQRYSWVGRYLVDPSGDAGQAYLKGLFHMLCPQWGYDYVKIDGQGGMAGSYEASRKQRADPKLNGDEAYRYGLQALRSQMGKDRFLLNCGAGWSSVGLCQGIRIGGDVGADWRGMQPAIDSTMHWLFLNNVAFWTDPDVVCVRPPLTQDQARMWATMLGITGQLLMSSDNMPALPEDRVEMLRRIYPVANVRPMNLYPLAGRPSVFDLKVARDWGEWDVVALFNWGVSTSRTLRLVPADLGLAPGKYVYYDVWGKQLLNTGGDAITLSLPPTSCKVIAVRQLLDRPQLIGASRHLTQGADDLESLKWDAATQTISGVSRVVGGDPYELRFLLPSGWTCATDGVQVQSQVATLTLKQPASGRVPWQIRFARGTASAPPPVAAPQDARLSRQDKTIEVTWSPVAGATGYYVYRNGMRIGMTAEPKFTEIPRNGGLANTYSVSAYALGGEESARVTAGSIEGAPVSDAWLDDLFPSEQSQEYGTLNLRRSVDNAPLRIAGKTYERGLGSHANAILEYDVAGYKRFTAEVGVDDEKGGAGTVTFEVWVDGRKLFDSGIMHGNDPAKHIDIALTGASTMRLVVTDAGDGISCDHADVVSAKLWAK